MKPVAILLCLSLSVLAVHGQQGKKWAVLIATANTWYNYGMQADVYHAYQVLRQGGIPEDQIVVMAYDDIAFHKQNPYQGRVFHDYSLRDVYKGVKIDYTKRDISKESFFAVLKGDKEAVKNLTSSTGRVIESGPDDNVFVFLSDHGGPGVVPMPSGKMMTAKELNIIIASMHKEKKFKNLVFYIDTCFSGSMFEGLLPSDIGVYAMTACGSHESAYSNECYSDAFEGELCLGGIYAINWVNQLQTNDRTNSTLTQLFEQVLSSERGYSTPHEYGDLSIAKQKQDNFFGDSAHYNITSPTRRSRRSAEYRTAVPKNMQLYHTLKDQLSRFPAGSRESQRVADELSRVEDLMSHADRFFKDIAQAVQGRFSTDKYVAWAEKNFGKINWDCYEPALHAVEDQCPGLVSNEKVRDYANSKFGVLVDLCNKVHTAKVIAAVNVAAAVNTLCDN